MNMSEKVMITGLGIVTSLGNNLECNWENLVSGKSGVKDIELFDCSELETKIAAEVNTEKLEMHVKDFIPRRIRKQMTRTTKMMISAAEEAIQDSGINLDDYESSRIAVILGIINTSYNENEKNLSQSYSIIKDMPNAPSAWLSIQHGLEGPNFNVSTACASSAYAIALGELMIKSNQADIVIAGGADSHINYDAMKGFNELLTMSVKNSEPQKASRPFSSNRDGFVMGEGAGAIILESQTVAKKRGAKVYCELAGHALSSEAFDIISPQTDGVGMCKTMRTALKNANINADMVDYINAHGTSTHLNDKYETKAIKECFGNRAKDIPISSTKSMLGHTIGAAGVIEAIVTVKSMCSGIITPTINYERDEELDLDYTPNHARKMKISTAISNSFGFGGHNATLVFKK